jgi:pimeloyl-ACP methyl ester carboxylesterase
MLPFCITGWNAAQYRAGVKTAMRRDCNHECADRLSWFNLGTQAALMGLVLFVACGSDLVPLAGVAVANDGYYRTLLPEMLPPPTPAPRNAQVGLCNSLLGSSRGRVNQMVIMADRPRTAAEMALANPALGVTLAAHALQAGLTAEQGKSATSVDLYFETVAFSWNFLKTPGATAKPEYESAWKLYHAGLTHLMAAAQTFGRLDPTSGLRVITAAGQVRIPTAYRGFVWKPEDFTRIEVVSQSTPLRLVNQYCAAGLGVPIVVVRERDQDEKFFNRQIPFPATVVLRPSLAVLAGKAPPIGAESSHGAVELYDPLRVSCVTVGKNEVPMATNATAALEYIMQKAKYSPWMGLLEPRSTEAGQEKLFLLEPQQPGKIPVVLVHGFLSSPTIWTNLVNEIQVTPSLRDRYQIMCYRYPTGRPFPESAAVLRRQLKEYIQAYDPKGVDPAMQEMVVIGHSMGGLVAKLTAVHSEDRLWYAAANRPLDEIKATPEQKARLRELFYFEPLPFVRRVIFLGTPHGGALQASRLIASAGNACIEYPTEQVVEHALIMNQNPGVFTTEISRRIPTSIDMLEDSSCLLKAIRNLCPGDNVQLHNIIGNKCLSPLSGCSDGVVSIRSAQLAGVSTEKRVHTTHGGLHEDQDALREIKCLLQRHLLELNDPPMSGEIDCPPSEFVVPEGEYPCPDEPQYSEESLCPDETLWEDCADELQLVDPCDEGTTVLDVPVSEVPAISGPVLDGPEL